MKKYSKRYQEAAKLVDSTAEHSLEKAIALLASLPKAKFDETVELSVSLGVDPRQSNQMVRGTVSLPHGSGKKITVAAFTEDAAAALAAGADFAGLDDLVKKVQEGWMDFDVAVSTTSAMKQVRTLARILGPRGLMPNPKSGTVSDDIAAAIQAVKAGRVEFKMDKTANVGVILGKRSFAPEALIENTTQVIQALGGARPSGFKGKFIKSMSLSATMSPGIRLETALFSKF